MKRTDPLLIISGPTSTGKTALALQLAKVLNGELVSADSRQVYKGMNIGTGKDLPKNVQCQMSNVKCPMKENTFLTYYKLDNRVRIWLYDVVDPDKKFSVAHWLASAHIVIEDIHKRGKLPIIVGGTGLYIRSLLEGIDTVGFEPDNKIRDTYSYEPVMVLQQKLSDIAPDVWNALNNSDRNNPRRLIRKIELALTPVSSRTDVFYKTYVNYLYIALTAPEDVLRDRIEKRVEHRVEEGIIQEVDALVRKGYKFSLPSMSGLGYRQWQPYVECEDEETKKLLITKIISEWKQEEWNYAKRQFTWFKKDTNIHWFDITTPDWMNSVEACIHAWYTKEDAYEN